MKKKIIITGGIGIILIVIGWLVVNKFKTAPPGIISPLRGGQPEEKGETKLAVWEDPAGFKFSYPQEIKIDPHEEDMENYAHLELISSNHPGKILIWMKDTNYKTLDEWVEDYGGDAQIFDSDLDGHPAKKAAWINPKKLSTVAFDVDVLVLAEVILEDKWWEETYDQILSSFEFIPLPGESEATQVAPGPWEGTGGESGIIDEGEEIIE